MAIGQEMELAKTWESIEQQLNEYPAPFQGADVTYGFNLSGTEAGEYVLKLAGQQAEVTAADTAGADCVLSMNVGDFYKLLHGKLNTTSAFMMGKLKVKGSLGLALKLEGILTKYRF
ncbi:SCP2 sterol-binding domain-containing protein [Sporosarcina trichiuri]|uniref:SCP2 sterol-binding domain-containing protein n=1 Tax=Sporosarcina trichiuri TaxID=3056445 RepID=UPI0025B54CD0|nr:SCP2 sterol-binding domain-containing protein [Sporosarcina sp. 0.2-SM1T-5]WJY26171.1 SCP2 sterol-binding domain-containing protein [Sporosarcina sp. 0.2-SM1T-5]